VIGVLESSLGLAEEAGLEEDEGVIEMGGAGDIATFIKAAKNGRIWEREPRLRTPK
jgi:catalase